MNTVKRLSIFAILNIFALAAMAQAPTGAEPAANSSASPSHHHTMMHHHMHDRPFLMVIHQLDLTADQHKQIHAIIEKSDTQAKASMTSHKEMFAGLMNPGDPNYANAIQAAKDAATARIEQHSQDNLQIYNLLTAEQKAKLPQVIDKMKQHMQEHHESMHHHQHGAAESAK